MLSREAQTVVRATLPIVGTVINDITKRFYERMFTAEPELLHLFNRGNQATNEQARALAGSVAAFATHLVAEPRIDPVRLLGRIAHKHAAVGVLPEQYTIVGRHLLAAVAEVLGAAATPEILAAWDEVYWLMACLLVAKESRLNQETGTTTGIWRPWRVDRRDEEATDVVSFILSAADGAAAPVFKSGQYISVAISLPEGGRQIRQYSLSDAPAAGQWRITVKRVRGDGASPDGAISTFLHESVAVGDLLTVSAPFGDVVLDDTDSPLLVASAGIGCTPVMSMLRDLSARQSTRPVQALHADHSPRTHALRDDLLSTVEALPNATLNLWYEDLSDGEAPAGARAGFVQLRPDPLPDRLRAYLCGPLPFMRDLRSQLLRRGVPAEQSRYEVFGPDLWLADESPMADDVASETVSYSPSTTRS